jgi:hypothetical protein
MMIMTSTISRPLALNVAKVARSSNMLMSTAQVSWLPNSLEIRLAETSFSMDICIRKAGKPNNSN